MKLGDNIALADDILESWDSCCKKINIPHLLIYGVCLGFHRDGGYIPTDNDIDVRVLCDQERWDQLVGLLATKGIIQDGNPAGYAFTKKGMSFNMERSEVVGMIIHGDGKEWPVMPLYNEFDIFEHHGRSYNMPHPVEEYLETRYGKDWKTPDPDWDNKTSGGA